ncbi:MAG: hypothetical protein COA62_15820 [Rhodobiaceae bacterium]|nr:MAG: hypothetical protein COA62_15820 [Rhodobiaceae bacterium]
MSKFDFNSAEKQDDGNTIPSGTIAPLSIAIERGGYTDPAEGLTNGIGTISGANAVYLNCKFTVLAGPYAGRVFFDLIGLHSTKGPKWADMGRKTVRGILESSRGVHPDDQSQEANNARSLHTESYEELDGIEFLGLIKEEEGEDGYGDKNKLSKPVTMNQKRYFHWIVNGAFAEPPESASPARKEKKDKRAAPAQQQWGSPSGGQPTFGAVGQQGTPGGQQQAAPDQTQTSAPFQGQQQMGTPAAQTGAPFQGQQAEGKPGPGWSR